MVKHASDAGHPNAVSVWDFEVGAKADQSYKFLMPRLDVGLATELRQVGKSPTFLSAGKDRTRSSTQGART